MPTRNVNLTNELDRFIARSVKRGHYANASEVMRSALRLLERDERDERKMARLKAAIQEGLEGEARDGEQFFKELRARIGQYAKGKGRKAA